jgi:hypothetical protein
MLTGNAWSVIPGRGDLCVLAVCFLLGTTGCVERQLIIESNVPNAQVYIDHEPAGPAPAYIAFGYYGKYNITIVHPGSEVFSRDIPLATPWYEYPVIDFASEVLWPFVIRDTRRYCFNLEELPKTRVDDLVVNAEALRQRAYNLPVPEHPAPPKSPPPQPGAGPSVLPPPTPLPPAGPAPGSPLPPVGPPANPNIPSVAP